MARNGLWMIILVCVLASMPLAHGAVSVYDGTLESGESVEIDDISFIFTLNKQVSRVFVEAGNMYESVNIYECDDMEMFRICFVNASFDISDEKIKMDLTVSQKKPDLSIGRQADRNEAYVGEEITITSTITNAGDPVNQVSFIDQFPEEIEIVDYSGPGCSVHENALVWSGHLKGNNSLFSCTYTIKGLTKIDQSLTAKLEYFDGFRFKTEYSSALAVTAKTILGVDTRVIGEQFIQGIYAEPYEEFDWEKENHALNIGETGRLLINITNYGNERIYLDYLDMIIPTSVDYKGTSVLRFEFQNSSGNHASITWHSAQVTKVSDSLARWEGYIESNASKLIIISFKGKKSGTYTVNMKTSYELEETTFVNTFDETFNLGDPGVKLTMSIEDTADMFSIRQRFDSEDSDADVESFYPYRLRLQVQNMNEFAAVKNLVVTPIIPVLDLDTVRINTLDPQEAKTTHNLFMVLPEVSAATEFKLNFSATFVNIVEESYMNSTEYTFKAQPFHDIQINHKASDGLALESGEQSEFTVTLTNDRLVDMRNVYVQDEISDDFIVLGSHSNKLKLNAEQDTQVYKYMLTAPLVNESKTLTITTVVKYFDKDSFSEYNITKESTFTILPVVPELSVTRTLNKNTETYVGDFITVDYVIKNAEVDALIRDITIYFPLQQETDLLGAKTFYIDRLDPGESITLEEVERFRIKQFKNSITINQTYIEYYDEYGNRFNENSSSDSINLENSSISGPAVIVNRSVPFKVNLSESFFVNISLQNIGDKDAQVVLTNLGKVFNITVPKKSIRIIRHKISYSDEGFKLLSPPEISYVYQDETYRSAGVMDELEVELMIPVSAEDNTTGVQEDVVEKKVKTFEELMEDEITPPPPKIPLQWIFLLITLLVIAIILVLYIMYSKGKKVTSPFIEEK